MRHLLRFRVILAYEEKTFHGKLDFLKRRKMFNSVILFLLGKAKLSMASCIYIICVTLNTEFDTVCLSGRYAQMTHFGLYLLVCPYSVWPGQGF